MEPFLTPYVVMSALITILGTVTNLLSLSYFVTRKKSGVKVIEVTEAINKKLFILLNSFDILVCVSLFGYLVVKFLAIKPDETLFIVIEQTFLVSVSSTGFITSLLSVLRAISIKFPLHNVNAKIVVGVSICFGVIELASRILSPPGVKGMSIVDFGILIGIFITVIVSNTVCIATLLKSKNVISSKRNATITIGILSLFYCFLNIGFLATTGVSGFRCSIESWKAQFYVLDRICFYIFLPLNSACNPVVYFVRNAKMRKYLTRMCKRAVQPCRNTAD
jgi:hypothetical protein